MPLALNVYRLKGAVAESIPPVGMDEERRLQDILASDIAIVDSDLMIIGREVRTPWDSRIDLLAINSDGHLVVLELKRNRTPRDVVAQVLEYGSWIATLDTAAIAEIYSEFVRRYKPSQITQSLDEAFGSTFGSAIPDELNASHQLLVIAAELDPGTERIVSYLTESHGVPVNVVFFRVFKDGEHEYLTRAWLREPEEAGDVAPAREKGTGNITRISAIILIAIGTMRESMAS